MGFPEEASFTSSLRDEYSWGFEKWERVGMCSSQAITVWLEYPVLQEGREETRKLSPGSIRREFGLPNKSSDSFQEILIKEDDDLIWVLEIFCLYHKGYIRGQ